MDGQHNVELVCSDVDLSTTIVVDSHGLALARAAYFVAGYHVTVSASG